MTAELQALLKDIIAAYGDPAYPDDRQPALVQRAQRLLDTPPEPVAVRYGFDGYGWQYADNGNGSLWFERAMKLPDAEPLYEGVVK